MPDYTGLSTECFAAGQQSQPRQGQNSLKAAAVEEYNLTVWAAAARRRGRRRVSKTGDPFMLPDFAACTTIKSSGRYLNTAWGRRCSCGDPVLPESD